MTAPNDGSTTTQNDTSTTGGATGTETGTTQSTESELSHEAALAELKRARDDAAKYRQRAREFGDDETYKRAKDAVAALDKAEQEKKSEVEKLTERNEGLMHRATSAEQATQKLRIALGQGIDPSQVDEFASRLRGDNEDELKADAVALAKLFTPAAPARRGDPSQGAGGDRSTPMDPLQAALEGKLGIG